MPMIHDIVGSVISHSIYLQFHYNMDCIMHISIRSFQSARDHLGKFNIQASSFLIF